MTMRRLALGSALFFLLALAVPAAQDVNIGGEWELVAQTPRGEMISTVTFEQNGESLTVKMVNERGETTGTGTIKGSDVEWTVTRSTPRGDLTMTYKGKVEGNTMKGQVQIGDFGTSEWTAKRKG